MRYKILFYVAEEHVDQVKQAVFEAGAGSYDGFTQCAWQTQGQGQYQPEGEALCSLVETKVELYCEADCLKQAIAALKKAHPCDQPAYEYYRIEQ